MIWPVSERVAEYANELLEQRRVMLCRGEPCAVVSGRDDLYEVWATEDGVICECMAGADHAPGPPKCAHAVAAMILWSEMGGVPRR